MAASQSRSIQFYDPKFPNAFGAGSHTQPHPRCKYMWRRPSCSHNDKTSDDDRDKDNVDIALQLTRSSDDYLSWTGDKPPYRSYGVSN